MNGMTTRRDDRGVALLWALAIMSIVSAAVLSLALVATREAATSGKFRDRGAAVSVAEGQLDVMVSRISSAVTAAPSNPSWPCGPVTAVVSDSGPHALSTTTTVAYFDANAGSLGCPPSGLVRSATVRTVASGPALPDTLPVRRAMEVLLAFTGGDTNTVSIQALPRSMFSQGDVNFTNSVTVTQAAGVNLPSLYTNGNFTCANSTSLAGDLVAQGAVSMANSCKVGGNLAAGGTVNAGSTQAKIGGNVVGVGAVNITGGSAAVGGTIRSAGSVSWSSCTSATCTPRDPTVAAPPQETLPTVPWSPDIEAAWVRSGWTVVKFENPADCALVGGTNAPGQWLLNNAFVAASKTVVRTTCPLTIGNNSTVTLARDVAVVADGGIALNNSMRFQAVSAASLYLIQPTTAVAPNCTTGGIAFNNNITFQPTVSLMLFTPCNISASQSLNVTGQFYAGGALAFSNSVALQFRPMPMPIPSGTTTSVNPYNFQVTGKRESQ